MFFCKFFCSVLVIFEKKNSYCPWVSFKTTSTEKNCLNVDFLFHSYKSLAVDKHIPYYLKAFI